LALYHSISQAGTISSEFNNTEPDMDKLEPHVSKEAAWRSRLLRHAQSGKSIAAFCREESVSTASFHIWRAKLAATDGHAANPAQPTTFIDLAAIKGCCATGARLSGLVSSFGRGASWLAYLGCSWSGIHAARMALNMSS
jgi:hypothetical protein